MSLTPTRGSAPNLVLVVLDTARRDVFAPYADTTATPVLAEVAERGAAHPDLYAPACWTVPSHGAMLAGDLPRSLGMAHAGGAGPEDFAAAVRANRERLLPEVLRRAGWSTTGWSANGWIGPATGFDTGFETWRSLRHGRTEWMASNRRRDVARWYLSALAARLDDGAAEIAGHLTAWLKGRDDRPFLWFVNLIECHSPYLPPRPHAPLGPLGRLRSAHDARTHQTFEGYFRACLAGWGAPEGVRERTRTQYLASIALLDDWVGRLLGLLDGAGVLDETVVVITSDHGENLGEDDLFGHAFSLDDRLIKVPFFQQGPVLLDLPATAQLQDLPRAVADAVGLDEHPWVEQGVRAAHPGIALAQLDAPGRRGQRDTEDAIRDWELPPAAAARLCTSFAVATDGRFKLWRADGTGLERLVDLSADPLERGLRRDEPVTSSAATDATAARSRLARALDDAEAATVPRHRADVDGEVDPDERDALERQLRGLGYL